jgi:hypothetical protein
MTAMLLADTHPSTESSDARHNAGDRRTAALRHTTAEELLHLGTHQVAYLKVGMRDGEMRFVLYGADGAPLVMAEDVETAVEMAAERGLGFVSVH